MLVLRDRLLLQRRAAGPGERAEPVDNLGEFITRVQLPFNDYYDYYGPDFQLHIAPSNMENLNHDS
jgi:hypothetical protein